MERKERKREKEREREVRRGEERRRKWMKLVREGFRKKGRKKSK